MITNEVENEFIITSQMEKWSILCNEVNYVQYNRHPRNFFDSDIKAIDQKSHKKYMINPKKRKDIY